VNRLLATAVVSALVGAVVALSLAPTTAQEAAPAASGQVGAVIDLTPITRELARMRAEMAAMRAAVADPEGLRGDVAKATTALTGVHAQVKELNDGFKAYAETTASVIQELRPARRWQYYVLRTRSESVINRLGREGWELVTGSEDWLLFRKPLTEGEKGGD